MGLSSRLAIIAAASATLLAPAAFAQVADPLPLISNNPSAAIPPTGSYGSGLTVSIWDTTKNVSLVEYLGIGGTAMNFGDALPASLAPSGGLTLDFGVVTGFSSTFAGSSVSNLVYEVTAASSVGLGATAIKAETTGPLGGFNATNNGNVAGVASAVNTFYGQVNAACPASVGCASDSSTNLNTAAFAGQTSYADHYNGQIPLTSAAASVGSSLGFYLLGRTSSTATATASVQQYANTSGIGQWLLNTDGHLTYTIPGPVGEVPLPAAVWLLLSGLSGLVTIGRRRAEAAAA
jgi:hypothetical protein